MENVFNVKLVKWPATNNSHSRKKPNNVDFGPERVIIVARSINLCISFGHQLNLKMINFTTRFNFNSIELFTTNSLLSKWRMNRLPRAIACRNLHFINHGLSSSMMIRCFMNSFRNGAYKEKTKEEYNGDK